mmetsp:Transcript_11657/g.42626  ORF Transcript_11657/g.42626 Transcript_11657/m.42626 type:complete len:205 (+) Transcript_11657:279-893(+)|eukprot:scaffold7377_cov389-Prasinococcus_capsulatus_cf.AAC.11
MSGSKDRLAKRSADDRPSQSEQRPEKRSRTATKERERASAQARELQPRPRSSLRDEKRSQRPSPPHRPDDKDGHYVFELGENLSSRYKILSKMGEGTFGRVVECWDRQKKSYCAIKIIRNIPKYRSAAMIEIDVLKTLQKHDPEGKRGCVKLKDWFDYRGHVCMVFERLGLSLYDFLRKNHYHGFALETVREFGIQLLEAVACK